MSDKDFIDKLRIFVIETESKVKKEVMARIVELKLHPTADWLLYGRVVQYIFQQHFCLSYDYSKMIAEEKEALEKIGEK